MVTERPFWKRRSLWQLCAILAAVNVAAYAIFPTGPAAAVVVMLFCFLVTPSISRWLVYREYCHDLGTIRAEWEVVTTKFNAMPEHERREHWPHVLRLMAKIEALSTFIDSINPDRKQ